MDKHLIIAGGLLGIWLVTLLFGKCIGPRIMDWVFPWFNKVTDKIDRALVKDSGEWDARADEILGMKPDLLRPQVDEICSKYGTPRPAGAPVPDLVRSTGAERIFERYSRVSFDDLSWAMEDSVVRVVRDRRREFLLIAKTADDGRFHALDLGDKISVFLVDLDEKDRACSVEDDCPSLEHLIVLQHEFHARAD